MDKQYDKEIVKAVKSSRSHSAMATLGIVKAVKSSILEVIDPWQYLNSFLLQWFTTVQIQDLKKRVPYDSSHLVHVSILFHTLVLQHQHSIYDYLKRIDDFKVNVFT